MLRTRVIVSAILLPIGLVLIYLGGWAFSSFVTLIVGLAAWEYSQIFRKSNLQPALVIAVAGAAALAIGRAWNGFQSAPPLLSLILISSMIYHMIAYERGRNQAGTDFAVTLSAALYIGWLGAYLISIRALPAGFWWLLLVLPIVWLADSGAYFIGRAFGKHKLSPRLSPKKTWEGYLGGVVVGTFGGVGLAYLWQIWAGSDFSITPLQVAVLGFLLSSITTLGDLGESMIKRQSGVKDSSNLIPGHGGVFDRIDSWLWAALIGYYFILWVVI
ncbi:MAG: phosphatidate cytidylyltransferase [Anaerolineales bacterium]|jgi:phosphatidate cytidylyltransferase